MRKFGKIFTDLVYGVIGLVIMNAVLSLLVNPYLGRTLGAAAQGKILFFTSLASLLAGSFGSAANYGRLKIYAEERSTENGEFNFYLLFTALLTTVVTIAAILIKGDSAGALWIGIIALIFATIVRYYADVEFRLNLNYKRFSLYYILIALGYGLGLLLYPLTHSWVLIMLTGECFGILYVIIRGSIFKKPLLKRTASFGPHMKTLSVLAGSYLLSDFVGSADRLILPLLLSNGDELTSIFYYASLVGKMMSLLSTPLNGVLAGHLSKSEEGMTRKTFLKLLLLMAGIFLVVTGISVAGSHLFVYLFYRPHYEAARKLFLLANAGQVIFFICNTLMVIVLRYTHERNQIIVSIVYIIVFFAVSVPMILAFGVTGMGWGILIANTVKFVMFGILGFFGIKEKKS